MKRIGYIDGRRMSFLDDYLLRFGTGKNITFGWDGAALNILPLTNNVGAINFGNGDKQVNVKIFLGSTVEFAIFDVGNSRVEFTGVPLWAREGITIGPATNNKFIYFYNTNNYMGVVGGVLGIGGDPRINIYSILTCRDYLQLFVSATPTTVQGQLYCNSSDSSLRWGHGAIERMAVMMDVSSGNATVIGRLTVGGKLRLGTSNIQSTYQGEMYIRTSDSTLRWGHGAIEFRALHVSGTGLICTFPGHVRLNVDDDSSTLTAGELWLQSTNSKLRWGHGAIVMEAIAVNAANKEIQCETFLRLYKQSGVGGCTGEGQIFLNTNDRKLYFHDGTAAKQITSAA